MYAILPILLAMIVCVVRRGKANRKLNANLFMWPCEWWSTVTNHENVCSTDLRNYLQKQQISFILQLRITYMHMFRK